MNYEEFKLINDRNKELFKTCGHIDSLDSKQRQCILSINGVSKVYDVDILIMDIINCRGCISNPSALSGYNFNIKPRDTSMVYRRNDEIILCHGTDHEIKKPCFGGGESSNDYGRGFYCVLEKNKELAKEWACSIYSKSNSGIVNSYKLRTSNLTVLNLDKLDIIYWVVLTATCRGLNINNDYLDILKSKYLLNISQYDCIYGWRCDDTFSNIINGFFNETLTAEAVYDAIRLGHLQQQFVLMSKKAFDSIEFLCSETVKNYGEYNKRFLKRKDEADNSVRLCQRNHRNGKYITDYL